MKWNPGRSLRYSLAGINPMRFFGASGGNINSRFEALEFQFTNCGEVLDITGE